MEGIKLWGFSLRKKQLKNKAKRGNLRSIYEVADEFSH